MNCTFSPIGGSSGTGKLNSGGLSAPFPFLTENTMGFHFEKPEPGVTTIEGNLSCWFLKGPQEIFCTVL
jgi:hypothetical protein